MGIPQKMKSVTGITVDGVDLTTVSNLVIRIQQGRADAIEIPLTVIDSSHALMPLTREQAEALEAKPVSAQVLWEDANGMPNCTGIRQQVIERVIGGGYGS